MITIENFKDSLFKLLPNLQETKFLVAVSGGVDSMVLCDLLLKNKLFFELAHVNYHLRDDASNLDQKLIEDFANQYQIKLHLHQVNEDEIPNNSIENWARDIRYNFFRSLLQTRKIDFILTAHHLNDQLETFLINLSKASGLKGLMGIPRNENNILRPLLDFTKNEIYDYAKDNDVHFREDHTNAENLYLRNRIRNQITPLLLETNLNFLDNFKKSLSIINDSKVFIEDKIKSIIDKLTIKDGYFLVLNKLELSLETDFVKYEILKRFGLESQHEITKLFKAENGKKFITSTHKILVGRDDLTISDLIDKEDNIDIILPVESSNKLIGFKIQNYYKDQIVIWEFCAKNIVLPLQLRKPKSDDYFNPKGMVGKKRVSKFIKDEKLPIFVRPHTWLLEDSKGKILGVFPYRQDGRFCLKSDSENLLKVEIKCSVADNVEA